MPVVSEIETSPMGGAKRSTKTSQKPSQKPPKQQNNKRGGALLEDITNLAVPFAILLAKEGLQGMSKKKTTEKKASIKKSTKKSTKV
jgi:hypothetical protein